MRVALHEYFSFFCFLFFAQKKQNEERGGNQSEGLAHLEYCAEMHRVDGAGAQAAADRGYLPCQWLSKGISFIKYLRKLFCWVWCSRLTTKIRLHVTCAGHGNFAREVGT